MCRLWQQALRAWVGHWYRAASGKLIAARHCQRLMATTVHALSQHARQQKAKYVAWRAAGQHWRRSVFRAFCRSAASRASSLCAEFLMLSHRPFAAICLNILLYVLSKERHCLHIDVHVNAITGMYMLAIHELLMQGDPFVCLQPIHMLRNSVYFHGDKTYIALLHQLKTAETDISAQTHTDLANPTW